MHKKLINIFLSVLFFSQEQQAMFRPSLIFLKNLKSSITPFTKNFLKLAEEVPFVENVQIMSFLPIQKEVEEKIYQMQENGTLIKMIVGYSVYKNQKSLVDKISERRSVIALCPKTSDDLDWGIASDFLGKTFEVRLLEGLKSQSKIQTALFFGESVELSALLSRQTKKENSDQPVQSLLIIKRDPILKLFEDDFEAILQAYKK